MKKIIVLFSLIFSTFISVAQTAPDIMPKFPGGMIELYKFFNEKMIYAGDDKEKHVAGELILTFTVDTSGIISNVEIKKGVSSKIDTEAKKVIQSMPAWVPAKSNGEKVNSRFSLAMMINAEQQIAEPIFRE